MTALPQPEARRQFRRLITAILRNMQVQTSKGNRTWLVPITYRLSAEHALLCDQLFLSNVSQLEVTAVIASDLCTAPLSDKALAAFWRDHWPTQRTEGGAA